MKGSSVYQPAAVGALGCLGALLVAWLLIWGVGFVAGPGVAIRMMPVLALAPGVVCGVAVGWLSRGRALLAAGIALGVSAFGGLIVYAIPSVAPGGLPSVMAGVIVAGGLATGVAFLRRNVPQERGGSENWLTTQRAMTVAGVVGVVMFGAAVVVAMGLPYPGFRQIDAGGAKVAVPASWVSVADLEGSIWGAGFQDSPDDWAVQLYVAPEYGSGGARGAIGDIDLKARAQLPVFTVFECANSVNQTGQYAHQSNECFTYQASDGQWYEVMWLARSHSGDAATLVQVAAKRGYMDDLVIAVIKDSVRPAV